MPQEATGKAGVPSDARQKPERPRDELGRPLPWDQPTRIHLPDFDAMTLDGCHQAGRGFLATREFFGAHEAWETAWKKAKGTGEEELFKGLSQMGAGYVHLLRGNAHGTTMLLRRAAMRIGGYPDGARGIDTQAVAGALEATARDVEERRLVPGPDAAAEPPAV
jgi:hypothetical protein